MARFSERYTKTDLWFNEDGDLEVDGSGDIKDTSSNVLRAVLQEIQHVLLSSTGDWKAEPAFAADLAKFIGLAATPDVADRVALRIRDKLVGLGVVGSQELVVLPLLVGETTFIRVILVSPTGETEQIHFGYDSDTKRFIGY